MVITKVIIIKIILIMFLLLNLAIVINLNSNHCNSSNIGSSNVDIHDIISKRDSKNKKTVFFIGDSMLKHVNGYGLLALAIRQFNVKSRFHLGTKICCLMLI